MKQNIAPNDKVPFYVLVDYALFLCSFCKEKFLTFVEFVASLN